MNESLTNQSRALLRAAFKGSSSGVWICNTGDWAGGPVQSYQLDPTKGNYFCIGRLKPGSKARNVENVETVHVIGIDDVGESKHSKIPSTAFDGLTIKPWVIQTSINNHQYLFPLPKGVPVDEYRRFRELMRWRSDSDMDPVHYFRLPQGVHGKNRGYFEVVGLGPWS